VHEIAVKFEDVSIELGGKLIWSRGNFEIERGTINAVIGSNGSGKTTLVNLLLGQLYPTNGKVQISAPEIGYVPQDYRLQNANALRGIDVVRLGLNGDKYFVLPFGSKRLKENSRIDEVLEIVHAKVFAKQRFSELSGGQQQRLAIAAALVNNPSMLILDEPLASLDMESAREIVALLQKLHAELGVTIIVVAHDLGLLLPILQGAIYLVDGHAHYQALDDAKHDDYGDLLEHLTTMKVGEHSLHE
jgi:zinc/manganese transport system ATP-binding protein